MRVERIVCDDEDYDDDAISRVSEEFTTCEICDKHLIA